MHGWWKLINDLWHHVKTNAAFKYLLLHHHIVQFTRAVFVWVVYNILLSDCSVLSLLSLTLSRWCPDCRWPWSCPDVAWYTTCVAGIFSRLDRLLVITCWSSWRPLRCEVKWLLKSRASCLVPEHRLSLKSKETKVPFCSNCVVKRCHWHIKYLHTHPYDVFHQIQKKQLIRIAL